MDNNEFSFQIVNKEGMEVKCDALAIFSPEEDNSNDETYIIYTDYMLDDQNGLKVYISRLVKNGEDFQLEAIKDYDKYPLLLERMQEEYNKLNAND